MVYIEQGTIFNDKLPQFKLMDYSFHGKCLERIYMIKWTTIIDAHNYTLLWDA